MQANFSDHYFSKTKDNCVMPHSYILRIQTVGSISRDKTFLRFAGWSWFDLPSTGNVVTMSLRRSGDFFDTFGIQFHLQFIESEQV